jgi:glycosyltransferase involved in cell wall biosynthesis
MSKIACFFNGPYLGGAERSFILQAARLKKLGSFKFDFVIPYLNDRMDVKPLTQELIRYHFKRDDMTLFPYDKKLFSFSRQHKFVRLFGVIFGLMKTVRTLTSYELRYHSHWWVNGNKIGFICFLYAFLFRYKGQFLWHFRDYPATHGFWRYVWLLLRLPLPFELKIIANSYDVADSLSQLNLKNVHVLYNPVEQIRSAESVKVSVKDKFHVGVVAMFAPWKGLHDIIHFAAMYEEKLKGIGVDRITIFGGALYETQGDHDCYGDELNQLCDKLKPSLISFAGLQKPEDIFSTIDLLIHPSLRAEPFGRVIVEAYAADVAVLSTGLGGAGELIEDRVNGCTYNRQDPFSFFQGIEYLLVNHQRITAQAKESYKNLDEKVMKQIDAIFL